LLIIVHPVYEKYRQYTYIDNFRAEIISNYWKLLNGTFLLIVVSGAALAGLRGRSPLAGLYGLAFSAKLALWLVQLYLSQQYLRPFIAETNAPGRDAMGLPQIAPPMWLPLGLLFLIFVLGFSLKYL
jgi:hypothetical protein